MVVEEFNMWKWKASLGFGVLLSKKYDFTVVLCVCLLVFFVIEFLEWKWYLKLDRDSWLWAVFILGGEWKDGNNITHLL